MESPSLEPSHLIAAMQQLENALKYLGRGFSVIPIKPDKKPYIKWEQFKTRRATREEIIEWWNRWPKAMIGIAINWGMA